jgi:hypothetical protein
MVSVLTFNRGHQISSNNRKNLILVSKIIQRIANGSHESGFMKNASLLYFKDFLLQQEKEVQQIAEEICVRK